MGFFDSIADAFSRDGIATKFTEKIPVVGYVTAGVQAIAGNPDHAKRAFLQSSVSTMGAVTGFVSGGPIGAVVGGVAAGGAISYVDPTKPPSQYVLRCLLR